MSGRQQHYLPQFLQRNFHFRKNGREHYVHVHRKDLSFRPNTSSVGQQRDFYGNPDSSAADDIITRAEGMLGGIVNRLVSEVPPPVSQEEFAVLLASLSLRTKKMRESLKNVGPRILAAISEIVDVAKLATDEYESLLADKAKLDALIRAQLAKLPRPLDRNHQAKFMAGARSQLVSQARAEKDSRIRAMTSKCEELLQHMVGEASAIAERAFLQIFENSSVPSMRVELFRRFDYSIVKAAGNESFILGDCAVVAVQSDGKPKLALGDVDEEFSMDEVWLPVSPMVAVVGSRNGFRSGMGVDQVNRMSAMLSHEFFISNKALENLDPGLVQAINTAEPLLSVHELGNIARQAGKRRS